VVAVAAGGLRGEVREYMSDDHPWNKAVVNAQKVGRKIRCFSMGDMDLEAAAVEWQKTSHGRRVAARSIVNANDVFLS
jgi:hypothetical protein